MAAYTLPSLYEVVKPENYYHNSSSSAFHRVGSPPELLHDSEDDGDSLSTSFSSQHHDLFEDQYHPRRKSVPHKSPSIIHDVFQASAMDKSVVFQWDTTLPPILSSSEKQQQIHQDHSHPSQQQQQQQKVTIIKPKVICGESLLSALRHRVALARQQDLPIKKRIIHMPRRQLTATCIELPNHHQQGITKHKLSIPVINSSTSTSSNKYHLSNDLPMKNKNKNNNNISIHSLIDPLPITPPNITSTSSSSSSSLPSSSPSSNQLHSTSSSVIKKNTSIPVIKQRGRKPLSASSNNNTTPPVRHTSSGRPSRVKGPCQACQETADGCMRKAFDWPFPTNQTFNDKGKPFVYLCNKCGLRFNKSGGCVCRHCRWVFCKEEKRKAMQYIEQMRRNRPDGYVDPEEEIENFVCTPKYWSCGRRWKVGWVLNSGNGRHDSSDDDDADTSSYPASPSL
ncbi:unnamed protein product [Cunninghamella blakesleeana]